MSKTTYPQKIPYDLVDQLAAAHTELKSTDTLLEALNQRCANPSAPFDGDALTETFERLQERKITASAEVNQLWRKVYDTLAIPDTERMLPWLCNWRSGLLFRVEREV